MDASSHETLMLSAAGNAAGNGKVSRRRGDLSLMNWPAKQAATGQHGDNEPYVCAGGYLHEFEHGRVECPLCGRGAYSRNEAAITRWENAHAQCCRRRAAIATA
jgi:hypothetical protein